MQAKQPAPRIARAIGQVTSVMDALASAAPGLPGKRAPSSRLWRGAKRMVSTEVEKRAAMAESRSTYKREVPIRVRMLKRARDKIGKTARVEDHNLCVALGASNPPLL